MKKLLFLGILALFFSACSSSPMFKEKVNSFGQTELMTAVYSQDLKKVEKLLDEETDLNKTDHNGANILHYTAQYGNEEIAQLLVQQDVKKLHNQKGGIRQHIPLQDAIQYNNPEVFKIFADYYPESLIDFVTEDGRGLLHYAAAADDNKIISELLEAGADPNHQDFNGDTPLHLFLYQLDKIEIEGYQQSAYHTAEQFFSKGYNPDIFNEKGDSFRTILNLADISASIRYDQNKHSLLDWSSMSLLMTLDDYDKGVYKNNGGK